MSDIQSATWREEITEWDKAPSTPNHIYITKGQVLLGYIPRGSKELQVFKNPKKTWSPARRKFRKLSPKEVQSYLNPTH